MIYIILIIIIIIITPITQVYLMKRKFKPVGMLVITENEGKKLFSLELAKNPDEIEKMRYVIFSVTHDAEEDID
jgi:hypothetical protein